MLFDFPLASLRFFGSSDIMDDGESFVTITSLCEEDYNTFSNDFVLVAQLLYIRKKKEEAVFNRRLGTTENNNHSYDRILMCRCLNSAAHLNCFAVLLGQNRNNRFFFATSNAGELFGY